MPFNGAGVYTPPAADFPVVTLTTISSAHNNNTINDIATALSNCITKDGQTVLSADIPFSGQFAKDGGVRAMDGSAGSPSFSWSADTDTGMFRNGTNNLAFTAGGAKVVDVLTTGVTVTGVLLANIPAMAGNIYGLTYANSAGDVTNDIDIAAGGAMAASNDFFIIAGAITKQIDAVWASGTGAGGLDTGSVGNNPYYIWLITNSTSGAKDALFSLSSTAPTMPSGYDKKRLIGWVKRSGGANQLFHTYETAGGGLELTWDSPTADVSLSATLTTTQRADAVRVPLNFSVKVHLTGFGNDAASGYRITLGTPSQTLTTTGGFSAVANAAGLAAIDVWVMTSATGTVGSISDLATVDTYSLATMGFEWSRR